MIKALAYVRCSTIEQSVEGVSIDCQKSRVAAYAMLKGMELVDIIVDAGISGGKPLSIRPGGVKLLKALHDKKASAVIVLKLDRAFRNAADCLTTIESWTKSNVSFHVVDLGGNAIDCSSGSGKFFLTVMSGAAELEKNLLRERTTQAMAHLRTQRRLISRLPYGWDCNDGINLTPNQHEQQTIKTMIHLRNSGMSYAAIATHLSLRSIKPKSANKWAPKVIWGILKNQNLQYIQETTH